MSRSSISALAGRFEEFVGAMFRQQGFAVEENRTARDPGHDLIVRSGPVVAVVEVKLYTSVTPATRNVTQALAILEHARVQHRATFGILATNSRLSHAQREQLRQFPSLRVYDFDVLAALASNELGSSSEFDEINRSALVFRGESLPTGRPVGVDQLIGELGGGGTPLTPGPQPAPSESPPTGARLCTDIHAVSKTVAKPFEKACEAAIRWLFRDELVAFDDQHSSHTGHNIFDLVARIASKEDFWQALITDFRARYVVFEFKNYGGPITQREVYTTEKYLYPVAMRGAAIIVSRHGADPGADKAMRGALRESGKLILSLSVEELCGMLKARDAGSDHSATLVGKLDGMLMGLER